jgi:hypothetical protein
MFFVNVFGLVVFLVAMAILALKFYRRSVKKINSIVLISVMLCGLLFFGLSSAILNRADNLGRPMPFKDLKENQEYTYEDNVGNLAVVSFKQGDEADIRSVYGFPGQLPKGTKFYKRENKIYEEIPQPKEVPKLEI